jgi:hypothetical protein
MNIHEPNTILLYSILHNINNLHRFLLPLGTWWFFYAVPLGHGKGPRSSPSGFLSDICQEGEDVEQAEKTMPQRDTPKYTQAPLPPSPTQRRNAATGLSLEMLMSQVSLHKMGNTWLPTPNQWDLIHNPLKQGKNCVRRPACFSWPDW